MCVRAGVLVRSGELLVSRVDNVVFLVRIEHTDVIQLAFCVIRAFRPMHLGRLAVCGA